MSVAPIQSNAVSKLPDVNPESLAGNQTLTKAQKIEEASRQFEAILLRQILAETQKPVITSEFTDNSTAAGIYQDYVVNTLAESLSKSGALGFAKIFDRQLSPPVHNLAHAAGGHATGKPPVTPLSPPTHHE